ncbi:hypothetical protein BATDEDRAFT_27139 [Batrachochytrium dendrobatidis JAM81]|uniref:Uncharacterized protein n=1 Tax=Batrachochytrium dendrobatidis (strain JAM81 / FGSC 10211) TaxID=684364 RepID=F4PA64_BATDJ|nr:uncharacterized protein BATDEDRAFT_27139 [Batrachochytrium dendrobatidis JAM81]EGF77984.1 hypothetical protein BATDEDRAFT_27139 [Batrachochytrium dendrobatidis JAM81]|eukprot:XP_006681388.1 hypothetical protein BATDEDRAFT_27139 [Batrachochytrium dendrobatidis JAM81]
MSSGSTGVTLRKNQRKHITTVGEDYCCWCKRCCEPFQRHVHSNTHQKQIAELLDKQATQLSDISKWIKKPQLLSLSIMKSECPTQSTHNQKTLECMFCNLIVPVKQDPEKEFQIVGKHILQHLCRSQHIWNVHEFFRTHRLKPELKSTFILRGKVFEQFKTDAARILQAAVKKHAASMTVENDTSFIGPQLSNPSAAVFGSAADLTHSESRKRKHFSTVSNPRSVDRELGHDSSLPLYCVSFGSEYPIKRRKRIVIAKNI